MCAIQKFRGVDVWSVYLAAMVGQVLLVSALAQTADSFNPGPNSWVGAAVVQTDGKMVFGGGFTTVTNQTRGRVARVNANGTLDTTFTNPNANDDVYALALLPDGKILVGGEFTSLGGQTRYAIGRLNTNGTLDTTFNATSFNPPPLPPYPSYRVQAVLFQPDGKIIVGGRVTTTLLNGQTIVGALCRRLNTNGSSDASFALSGSANGPVSSLAFQPDGSILVGGQFTTFGGQSRTRLARIGPHGALETNFNVTITPNVGSGVSAIVVQPDGKILLGGLFDSVAGQPRTNIARLISDGTIDAGFSPSVGNSSSLVYTLTLQTDGQILVGGIFSTLAGSFRNRIGRLQGYGSIDPTFNPGANLDVYGLTVQPEGAILAAGYFSQFGGQSRSYLGRLPTLAPATQSLSYSNTTLSWHRGGSSPEVWRTTFELSTNGTNWIKLGDGTRTPTGWQLTNASLPSGATIRARGYTTGGAYDASSWFVESRMPVVPQILMSNGLFGVGSNGLFGFTVSALTGSNVVVEASTNLTHWSAIETNTADTFGSFYFHDWGTNRARFYRARFE